MARLRFIAISTLLTLCGVGSGHDYWLQPSKFYAKPKEKISVRLLVGDGFEAELERGFQKEPTTRCELISAKHPTVDLRSVGKEDTKPFAELQLAVPASYWLVVDRQARLITLTPEKFNNYLKHEGLTAILKQRRELKEDKNPGRERYSRCVKCLLGVGAGDDQTWKQPLKQRLEITPLSNPAKLKPGDSLRVRITFEGKPLVNAPVFAYQKQDKKVSKQSLHTNQKGVAEVKITKAGTWLVRLVHMRRTKDSKDADWESIWGAMSFGVRR